MRKKIIIIGILCVMATANICSAKIKNSEIKLSKSFISIQENTNKKIKLCGAIKKKVVWKTSNKKIATVKAGVIKGNKKGDCYVIAKYRKKKYSCKVRVYEKKNKINYKNNETDITPTQDNLNKSDYAIQMSETYKIEVTNVTNTVISYKITNQSDSMLYFGNYIILEKYVGNQWVSIDRKETSIPASALMLEPSGVVEMTEDLSNNFADLEKGTYRIGMTNKRDEITEIAYSQSFNI